MSADYCRIQLQRKMRHALPMMHYPVLPILAFRSLKLASGFLSFLLYCSVFTSFCPAGEPVVLSEKALRKLDGNLWYDRATQSYRTPQFRALPEDTIRRTGWERTTTAPKSKAAMPPAPGTGWR
jgi:hypothetical protein